MQTRSVISDFRDLGRNLGYEPKRRLPKLPKRPALDAKCKLHTRSKGKWTKCNVCHEGARRQQYEQHLAESRVLHLDWLLQSGHASRTSILKQQSRVAEAV